MHPALQQRPFRIRMEWGLDGAEAIGRADVAIVVDVLSFSTCVSVAVDAGVAVLPYRWADDSAAAYAAEHEAVLAVRRSEALPGEVSLSPGSIRAADGLGRLVLPSPNGSTVAAHLQAQGARVLAGSLRNAEAIAAWLTGIHRPDGATVAVIAAGERWPDGRLRPAVEDLWGAGALVSALQRAGWTSASPEAATAAAAFEQARPALVRGLTACASGAELVSMGFGADIEIAAELDVSRSVPLLGETGFAHAARQPLEHRPPTRAGGWGGVHRQGRVVAGRPEIVCLCGSARFMTEVRAANRELTLAGAIVLAPSEADESRTPEQKAVLDALHLRKIDLADRVLIVNPGGYVGESTRREIAYARASGKPITFTDPV